MKVSALITNYNYDAYVGAAVELAIRQTCAAIEVVVVDDGSRDQSRQVIEQIASKYSDQVLAVFQSNGGQAAAINAGFARCTGDIICMLDADDLWDATKVQRVVAAFEAEPDAMMVMHSYRLVDPNNLLLDSGTTGQWPQDDLAPLMIQTGGAWVFGATSSLSLRRSALEKILPIPAEKWRLCADGAIAYPAAFLGKVISIDDVLGSYRVHGSNNHFNAGLDPEKVQADVEMTNAYLNDFLNRIGRPERVDLSRNLSYRRDRFYRHGGGLGEALAITRLILTWPLYNGPLERTKFLLRFWLKALSQWHRTFAPATQSKTARASNA